MENGPEVDRSTKQVTNDEQQVAQLMTSDLARWYDSDLPSKSARRMIDKFNETGDCSSGRFSTRVASVVGAFAKVDKKECQRGM